MAAALRAQEKKMTDVDEHYEEETEETTETVETEEETKGEEESKESESETPSEPTTVPIAALLDVRSKNAKLREENEALKKQLPEDDSGPDPVEDPDGYKSWVKSEALKELHEDRIETSRSQMLEKEDDYEEMETIFMVLSSKNEDLVKQMNDHPDPARFAYEKGKEYLDNQRESLKSELTPSEEESEEEPEKKVPSLANATAQASNTTPLEKDDDKIDGLFEDQAY